MFVGEEADVIERVTNDSEKVEKELAVAESLWERLEET